MVFTQGQVQAAAELALAGFADGVISEPKIELLDGRIKMACRLSAKGISGKVVLSGVPTYDAEINTIGVKDATVEKVVIEGGLMALSNAAKSLAQSAIDALGPSIPLYLLGDSAYEQKAKEGIKDVLVRPGELVLVLKD